MQRTEQAGIGKIEQARLATPCESSAWLGHGRLLRQAPGSDSALVRQVAQWLRGAVVAGAVVAGAVCSVAATGGTAHAAEGDPPAPAEGTATPAESAPPAGTAQPGGEAPAVAQPGDGGEAGAKRTALTRELAEQGEAELFKSVQAFQQRYLVKAKRVELQLGGASSMADPMFHHYSADVDLLFHFNEHWAVGAGGAKWFGATKSEFGQIQRDFGLFPEKSTLQAGGHGFVEFSPVVGKFAVFSQWVLQIDGYGMLGGGGLRTSRGEDIKPYMVAGVGLRFHTARWLSLSLELRDIIYSEGYLNNSDRLMQQVFGGIKLGLWLPPTVQYKYPR